jgi:hypothetical protein
MAILRSARLAPVAFVALAACFGKDPYNPGTPLGTFHVVGKLTANTCGEGGTAPDPWTFDVKLARDAGTLYWIQGGPPVQGTLDAQGHTSMKASDTQTIHPGDNKIARCALRRDDALGATIIADPDDKSGVIAFTGTLSYTFSQTDDSDCSDQLTIAGGGFAALPCSVDYIIAGNRTALPKASP